MTWSPPWRLSGIGGAGPDANTIYTRAWSLGEKLAPMIRAAKMQREFLAAMELVWNAESAGDRSYVGEDNASEVLWDAGLTEEMWDTATAGWDYATKEAFRRDVIGIVANELGA